MSTLIPIIICEDDDVQREFLENFIRSFLEKENFKGEILLSSSSAKEVISFIVNNSIKKAIYILDIELKNNENGLLLAEEIKEYDRSSYIIFLTGHESYLKESFLFKTEALDFILKSDENALRKRLTQDINYILKNETYPIFSFTHKNEKINLPISKINYISTSYFDHELIIHALDKNYSSRGNLNQIAYDFPEFLFIHRSIVVNSSNIFDINLKKRLIIFKNLDEVRGSVRKFKNFLEVYKAKIR